MTGVLVLCLLGLLLGGLLAWARRLAGGNDDALVESIQAVLPQTQCAQCGYPGCRPYAEAVANGAEINRCPPGGETTIHNLAALLGRAVVPLASDLQPTNSELPAQFPVHTLARIDEQACIGCALCLPACPVDAIVGAPRFMHTVVARHCTGCELCLAPCPVDCISMQPAAPLEALRWLSR
jgi:electron transport complex protein RnfB